ncbi:hypothetical protein AB1Y20_017735 [Prymnesium parvum]|uniref:Uncharacterized protein n=1 Tax=Prymnesium parvum TaxID=97485 RepID=A0AB34JNZ0_PRYPA
MLQQTKVDRSAVERLVGRLGHIAQIVAEGNAQMQPLFRLQNATFRHALAWWTRVLSSHVTVPLAPRLVFPEASESGCVFVFTDAAREMGTGHGGFTCVRWEHG